MNDVLIIIVTYNRLQLLERCIDYCNKLSFKNRDILVIDNNSNDGTSSYLNKLNILNIRLKNNSGSSVGWNTGIEYALKKNYKYVWLMDDDGYPDKDSLTKLLENFNNDYACISSLVVSEDNPNRLVFSMPIMKNILSLLVFNIYKTKNINFLRKYSKNKIYEFAHLFNGSLIKINTIRKIGNVEKNYFMYGDEVDYFYRLKKVGKVVTFLESFHFHPNVDKRKCSKFWIYYNLKNSIIINKKYRNFFIIRSFLTIILCLYRVTSRNGVLELINILVFNKYKFYAAIINGFKNKIGNDFK